jgi:3-oxoacyl-[acyl-carrier-protein] synthase II
VRRVVVTGLGALTPIGNDPDAFHAAQLAGRSGVRTLRRFDASAYPTRIAGEVDVDVGAWLDRKQARRLDRFAQLAIIAAEQALDRSGLDLEREDRTRVGTLLGSGIGGMDTWEKQSRIAVEKHPLRMSPFFIPMMISNMASAQVAMRHGLMGPSSTVVTACSTGSDAIGSAFRMLQHGEAEVMVAGGAEAILTPMALGGFAVMKALSTRNDDPEGASRPFSATRDGFVMGEGAGVLVLETLDHARERGAPVLAEMLGYGRAADAHHMVEPHPEGAGAALAMEAALRDARLDPDAIGYVNAHATSTPVGDLSEVRAFKRVFGDHAYRTPISSTKSMIGHLLGAAGAVEAIATIQAVASGVLPPTINLGDPDPELDLDFVPHEAREQSVRTALSNSFAFGGQNASLIFGRV